MMLYLTKTLPVFAFWKHILPLSAICLCSMSSLAFVDSRGDQEGTTGEVEEAEDSEMAMAYKLAHYGRTTKTPEALVTAAIIVARNPAVAIKSENEFEPGEPDAHIKEAEELLNEAEAMLPDDRLIKTLADRSRESIKEKPRGIGSVLKKIQMLNIPKNSKKKVITVKKKKGEKIKASASNTDVSVGVLQIGDPKPVAKMKGSVSVKAPKDGEYDIVVETGSLVIRSLNVSVE